MSDELTESDKLERVGKSLIKYNDPVSGSKGMTDGLIEAAKINLVAFGGALAEEADEWKRWNIRGNTNQGKHTRVLEVDMSGRKGSTVQRKIRDPLSTDDLRFS